MALPILNNPVYTLELPSTGEDIDFRPFLVKEQKALMIAAILAHARLQAGRLDRPPLLLLDDVAAHLDEEKRHCLFAATSELKGQVWYSGTDRVAFSAMNQFAQFFNVSQGQIEPQ